MSDFRPLSSDHLAPPVGFGCPACGGSLFQLEGRPSPRFRCRVGHAWSPETLLAEQAEMLEGHSGWRCALREKADLSRRMDAGGRDHYLARAEDAELATATLQELLAGPVPLPQPTTEVG
ncbi:hypothetical protein AB0G04_28135 [Actinoplanes sp. NPDC023801]|uniref:hypothetical protein n=1 Tax=Actinoplanes sp. NPDC023801 TaxID=3154595 RepID=UPI0034059BB1